MDSCRNPQISLDEMLKWKKRANHLESELSALKTLIRMMAETLLFYSERGGGRARDLYRHPLTQQVLDESGYYEVKV